MDSILIYQAANDLVQNTGTRNIKRIARSCSLDILETPRFKDVLGFLSLHFDKPLILINRQLDKQTKQQFNDFLAAKLLDITPECLHRFWAFQHFQPPPLILRKNEGIMSLPCSAIKQARSRGILHEFYTPP